MHILHIIESMPRIGGTPTKLAAIARGLSSLYGVQSSFVCTDQMGELGEHLSREGFKTILCKYPRWNAYHIFAIYKLIQELAPDAVVTHFCRPGVYGRLAGMLASKPIMHQEHGIARRETFAFRLLDKVLAKRTAMIVANSEATKRHVAEVLQLDPETIVVCYPYVAKRSLVLSQAQHSPRTTFVFGTVGGLNSWKGHDTLLHAAALLKAEGADCESNSW